MRLLVAFARVLDLWSDRNMCAAARLLQEVCDELGLKVAVEQRIARIGARQQDDPVVAQVRKPDAADRAERDCALQHRLWPLVYELRNEDEHGARRHEQEAWTAHARAAEARDEQLRAGAKDDSLACARGTAEHAALGAGAVQVEVVAEEAAHADETESAALLPPGEQLVAVVAQLQVLDALVAPAPCALDPARALVSVAHVRAPRALDTHRHIVPVAVAHRLKRKERLGVFDKALGHAKLPLVTRDARVDEDALAATACVALPDVVARIRGRRREQIEPLDDLLKCVAVCKACTPHADVLLETQVLDLVQDRLRIVLAWAAVLVRLDRADVRRLRLHQVAYERVGTRLDAVPGGRWTLLGRRVRAVGKELPEEGVARAVHELENVLEQRVLVLVRHAVHVVHHIACIVPHKELGATCLKVRVRREHRCTLHERVVRGARVRMRCRDRVVQRRKDTRRTTLLDQVTYDLVVEILDRCPLDLFLCILFLLLLQREFDKYLLQLLVHVVDAQLLERVVLKNLKAIDVEHTDNVGCGRTCVERLIKTRNNPFKQIVVDRLGQRVAHGGRLRRVQRHLVDRATSSAALRFHLSLIHI